MNRSRQPPCRPEPSLTGISPISGSAVRVAELQSSETVHSMTAIDASVPSVTPWQL